MIDNNCKQKLWTTGIATSMASKPIAKLVEYNSIWRIFFTKKLFLLWFLLFIMKQQSKHISRLNGAQLWRKRIRVWILLYQSYNRRGHVTQGWTCRLQRGCCVVSSHRERGRWHAWQSSSSPWHCTTEWDDYVHPPQMKRPHASRYEMCTPLV